MKAVREFLSRFRLLAYHGFKWRRTLRQIDQLPERKD